MQRKHRFLTAWSLVAVGAVGLAGVSLFTVSRTGHASADTIVTNCSNDGSSASVGDLQHAIAYANSHSGSTITFTCPSGTDIKIANTLTITSAMTINGGSHVTLDGQDARQVLNVTDTGAGTFTLENIAITHGNGTTQGGGMAVGLGTVDILNSTFAYNTAYAHTSIDTAAGGALYDDSATVTITNSTFENNSATADDANAPAYGGALFAGAGTLIISDSTISNNAAVNTAKATPKEGGSGGGIYISSDGTLTLTNSTVWGNSVEDGTGGGIYNGGPAMALTNSTIVNNTATDTGVGNTTLGGGLANFDSRGTITATIIANNTGPVTATPHSDANCYMAQPVTSGGYNLENGAACLSTPAATDEQNVTDPKVATTLTNNGGSTKTAALLKSSPAINAIPSAKCAVKTDQRGYARPVGGACDIGAYEYAAIAPATTGRSGKGNSPSNPVTAQAPSGNGSTANSGNSTNVPKSSDQQPKTVAGTVAQPATSGFPVALVIVLAVLCFGLMGSGVILLARTRKTTR